MLSYLGSFPFGQEAPVILGHEQMIMVIVILTERYKRVLKKGHRDRTKLFFRSLAVYDRKQSTDERTIEACSSQAPETPLQRHPAAFAVDQVGEDDEEDDDDLALAALEALDAIEVFKLGDAPISQASIPPDNLKKLIMLLLLIAPLDNQQSLAHLKLSRQSEGSEVTAPESDRISGEQLDGLRKTADNILAAFVNVEKTPGIKFHQFSTVIPVSLPFLFAGFSNLFEHFLFSKHLNFTKHKDQTAPKPVLVDPQQPLLPDAGNILDLNVLSQLSFFLPGSLLFRRLRLLYSGGDAGFSMGSFETRVFNWRAPTILLVSGNRISAPPSGGQERAFSDTLPPKKFPDSSKCSHVVFGAYITQPWRQTHKECFGDSECILFQLEPVHEVFHATSNAEYISFTKSPSAHPGISFGCPHPKPKTVSHVPHASLGAVSLMLDSSFEFGVFTHAFTSGGGAFHTSETRRSDFQDRFEIEDLEVWGCGGDAEAEQQRQRFEWEEREAEARRRINIGKGDIEADRALLEMAGVIGGNRSGGSMN